MMMTMTGLNNIKHRLGRRRAEQRMYRTARRIMISYWMEANAAKKIVVISL
jgi:hypothetical protein